jgi:D-alanyl-D-alanine carboxypeptidase
MNSLLESAPFSPVAVESPGGGRVKDKRDPAAGDVVTVRGLSRPIPLHRLAAQAWSRLVEAARADGIAEPLLLPVSGYRSGAHQERLWRRALARYGSPEVARRWVAPPGSSAHQSGRAIDFHLGGRNDSANIARLRQTPAYRWLAANARRFGFYPYEQEPWHWEYNPPGSGAAPPPAGTAPPVGAGAVRAGELQVPGVPVLAGHRGRAPALMLGWNDMPSVPREIDLVVHLHGYARPGLSLPDHIRPHSGLDFAPVDGAPGRGRSRPTLALLPRGHDTGVRQRNGGAHVYTFPALDGTDGRRDGLTRLISFALQRFAAQVGGPAPRAGRLILTAHSGGGQPLLRILRFTDPQEVHVYDGLYWPADALVDWAARHVRQDRGGAMRVFFRAGTGTEGPSRRVRDALAGRIGGAYRVEASTLGHWQIPRTYGWRVLADASADVPHLAGGG